ncbi:hypothetical protein M433DRAFT_151442 [Acidomyces richmondensis BFW]|nr:MAG: hypothetical protein FE78DRAFT_84923 [Acidomyces sp. 'richmondensis']KYG48148.1 hypothetical protein M433DRAFT_151442 [Acidomyces richmondensis BFW]
MGYGRLTFLPLYVSPLLAHATSGERSGSCAPDPGRPHGSLGKAATSMSYHSLSRCRHMATTLTKSVERHGFAKIRLRCGFLSQHVPPFAPDHVPGSQSPPNLARGTGEF